MSGPDADFQAALDQRDVVGVWEWDILNDEVRTDELVARLFGLDPKVVSEGVALSAFIAAIHPDDRKRAERAIGQSAAEGGVYVAEYRVRSADNVERWVFARGRFYSDDAGAPTRGRGIVVDMTRERAEHPGSARFSRADPTRCGALDRLAEHCIGAHRAAQEVGNETLRKLINNALLEVGYELARTMSPPGDRPLH